MNYYVVKFKNSFKNYYLFLHTTHKTMFIENVNKYQTESEWEVEIPDGVVSGDSDLDIDCNEMLTHIMMSLMLQFD